MDFLKRIQEDLIDLIKLNGNEINFLGNVQFNKEKINISKNYPQVYEDTVNDVKNLLFINDLNTQDEVSDQLEEIIVDNIINKINLYNKWHKEINLDFNMLNFNYLISERYTSSPYYISLLYSFDCFNKEGIDSMYNLLNTAQKNNLIQMGIGVGFEKSKEPIPLILGKVIHEFLNDQIKDGKNKITDIDDSIIKADKEFKIRKNLSEKLVEYEKRILMSVVNDDVEKKTDYKKRI